LNAIAKSMKHATKEAIMQIPAAMLLFISWRTSRPSTAGREARIERRTLPAVGCADLLCSWLIAGY
jgi:hypothetical protein